MSDIYPVTRERHGARAFNKTAGFGWARKEQVVPVALQEATNLMMQLPLGFLQQAGQFQLIALLGIRPGENVWVAGDGRWLAPRVPAVLQHYPFRLLRSTDGREVLGVDEAALLPPGAEGTRLFDDEGKAVPELGTTLEQLVQAEKERELGTRIAGLLHQHELLEPWPLQVQDEGRMRPVEGLYRVNEKKLNELPAEALQALRNGNALLMAYVQMLSMQHIHQLGRMAEAMAVARQRMAQTAAKDSAGEHGIISFANL